ncbi:MAG: hypothetical protein JOZ54_04440 [Acidobacteria bacterium]|nr:hypothetical protein [Acidobacteriota bacterium]
MSPTRLKLVFLAIALAFLPFSAAQAQPTPVDLVTNNTFEDANAPLGFAAISPSDGAVEQTTVAPITGTGSLEVTVNSYGRVVNFYAYGYGSGPNARYVTLNAKLRVDSSTISGRELTACAVAYFMDSQVPESVCQNFPVDPLNVVDVSLALDTNNRQLNYLFPQFALNDSGTIVATVDDVHYTVFEAQLPEVPSGYEMVDRLTNNSFDNALADLGWSPFSPSDGSVEHTTTNPIIGTGSMKISVNSYGRIQAFLPYGYGSGPFAKSVSFAARVRVDSSTIPGRELTACAIAYYFNSQDPEQVCQSFPVNPSNVVDVFLNLDTHDQQLQYIFPQFSLNDSGTIEATVDQAHFYVVQPQ